MTAQKVNVVLDLRETGSLRPFETLLRYRKLFTTKPFSQLPTSWSYSTSTSPWPMFQKSDTLGHRLQGPTSTDRLIRFCPL